MSVRPGAAARRRRDAAAFRTPRAIDAREIDEPSNHDEALAVALLYSIDGDTVTLHAEDCPTTRDSAWQCRCEPVRLTVGAKA